MNQQRVGQDFFSARLETNVPQRMISTVTFTSRQCPVCGRFARTLVRPPHHELQSEICDDFCDGRTKYPNSYVSFQGSWLKDGNVVIETLKGADGAIGPVGPPGRDASPPTKEELKEVFREVLREQGFWRRLFGRIK
jgi:hypothetical protein